MGKFSWLHLSDLHMGSKPEMQRWLPATREMMEKDLLLVFKKTGPLDILFFTGDLTFSGQDTEFKQLDSWLKDLEEFLAANFSRPPLLIPIPGNHDLRRPSDPSAAVKAITQWSVKRDDDVRNDIFQSKKGEYSKVINESFINYSNWIQRQKFIREQSYKQGLVPGDFSLSLEFDNIKVGIVGLNSALFQLSKENFKGKLHVDTDQLNEVCDKQPSKWCKQHDLNFLLTHHPPSWLAAASRKDFEKSVNGDKQFDIHLFGHMHDTHLSSYRIGGAPTVRLWQVESLFSDVTISGIKHKRKHGYCIGQFEISKNKGKLSVWPRTARDMIDGKSKLIPYVELNLNEEGSIIDEFEINLENSGKHIPSTPPIEGNSPLIKPNLIKTRKTRIGIITTGRDAPGVNACIRAIVRVAAASGIDIIGIPNGFQGLTDPILGKSTIRGEDPADAEVVPAQAAFMSEDDHRAFYFYNSKFAAKPDDHSNRRLMRQVSMIIHRGGSILLSGQCEELLHNETRPKALTQIVTNINHLKLTHLVIIGGKGSMNAACHIADKLKQSYTNPSQSCRIIGIPASIENDLFPLTTVSIGYDTALNTLVQYLDKVRDSSAAMVRTYISCIAGDESPLLAVETAIAAGAEIIQTHFDNEKDMKAIIDNLALQEEHEYATKANLKNSKKTRFMVVSEPAMPSIDKIMATRANTFGWKSKPQNISLPVQMLRGGAPSGRDRVVATSLGHWVAQAIIKEDDQETLFGDYGWFSPLLASLVGESVGWAELRLSPEPDGDNLDLSSSNRSKIWYPPFSYTPEPDWDKSRVLYLSAVIKNISQSFYKK